METCTRSARWVLVLLVSGGCATAPTDFGPAGRPSQAIPTLQGSYHRVRRGETLWRIAQSYGLEIGTLAAANRIPVQRPLRVGQRLFIPLPTETDRFLWPVLGSRSVSSSSKGVEIAAARGTLVRASRSGRVAVATRHLAGWGKTIVLDHLDGHFSVYAGLDELLVDPTLAVRQGMPIGTMSGRPLHFEIRYGEKPRQVLALLPAE